MRLRAAVPEDAAAIAAVHVASWRSTYRGLLPDAYLDGMEPAAYAERWRRSLERPAAQSVFVADEGGTVVGFAACGVERDGDPRYAGELYAIYLLDSAQRRGTGRALVEAAVRALGERGITSMVVWVLRDNVSARRFYERLGGTYLRERPLELGTETITAVPEVAYFWADTRGLLEARQHDE